MAVYFRVWVVVVMELENHGVAQRQLPSPFHLLLGYRMK